MAMRPKDPMAAKHVYEGCPYPRPVLTATCPVAPS
jgi:hypothetical protein